MGDRQWFWYCLLSRLWNSATKAKAFFAFRTNTHFIISFKHVKRISIWCLETGIPFVAPLAIPSCRVRGQWRRPPVHRESPQLECVWHQESCPFPPETPAHSQLPPPGTLCLWGTLSRFFTQNLQSHRKNKWVFLMHSRLVHETEKGDSNSWIQHEFHYTELPCVLTRMSILVLLKI